jgi:hypothetical protein
MKRIVIAVVAYALAMAFVEAAVVVNLRALGHAGPSLASTLPILPRPILLIEGAREAATIVMLAAVAIAAGRSGCERAVLFSLMFAVWDIGYYGWLWVLVRWPPSLFTWDVLFLIPVPWMGPVLAPVLASLGIVIASLWLLGRLDRGERLRFSGWGALGVALGLLLALAAFVVDYRVAQAGREPATFHWGWFAVGLTMSGAALVAAARKRTPEISEPEAQS